MNYKKLLSDAAAMDSAELSSEGACRRCRERSEVAAAAVASAQTLPRTRFWERVFPLGAARLPLAVFSTAARNASLASPTAGWT